MLGVLQLRQDLPAAGDRDQGISGFRPLGANVIPMRGTDSIMWTIKFRNGILKRFKFPIRTTAEGSVDPYKGKPEADDANAQEAGLLHHV